MSSFFSRRNRTLNDYAVANEAFRRGYKNRRHNCFGVGAKRLRGKSANQGSIVGPTIMRLTKNVWDSSEKRIFCSSFPLSYQLMARLPKMFGVLRRRIFCSSLPLSYRLMARLTKNVRVCRKRGISALASLSHISRLVASPKMRRVRRGDIVCSSFLLSYRSTSRFAKNIRDCGKRAFSFEIPSPKVRGVVRRKAFSGRPSLAHTGWWLARPKVNGVPGRGNFRSIFPLSYRPISPLAKKKKRV